jgi:hypothetical protein
MSELSHLVDTTCFRLATWIFIFVENSFLNKEFRHMQNGSKVSVRLLDSFV